MIPDNFSFGCSISDTACLSLLVSKLLGAAIILGSLIVKVPQIIKIINAKSVAGISMLSVVLEMVCYLFTLSYCSRQGLPFTAYGETVFISVQNVVIFMLLFVYGGGLSALTFLSIGAYLSILYVFIANPGNLVPFTVIAALQATNIPIIIASRIPQIWTNFRTKSTGQLALITWLLNFAGSAARIFTTMKEAPGDTLLLAGYVIGVALNGAILLQIIMWGDGKAVETSAAKKAQRMKKAQ